MKRLTSVEDIKPISQHRRDIAQNQFELFISIMNWFMNKQITINVKTVFIFAVFIVIFNIITIGQYGYLKKTAPILINTVSQNKTSNTTNPAAVPSPARPAPPQGPAPPPKGPASPPKGPGHVTYYELTNDTGYHYEFRFEKNNITNNDTRLMILLNGSVRTCVDYWDFAVGRRILAQLHSFRFSILVICSKKKTYDLQTSLSQNLDAKWIYIYLQKWINEVYYKQFRYYPRLYIHGISRGSRIAGLLCRILPIQHQILTVYPGEQHGMLTRSHYPIDLQRRLQLDSVFANWFYFDFCYKPTLTNSTISEQCPFQRANYSYQPVPPTYFIHLQNDRLYHIAEYTRIIDKIHKDAFALGGKLLNNTEAVKFYVMTPSNATPTYMQETYDTWRSKPHASAIFFEHYVNRSQYKPINSTRQTCPCLPTDFRYYQLYPNITQTWSKQKQDEYKDYADDIERYIHFFCEDVCADLYTDHGMSSRHLDKALEWVNEMDKLRHSLLVEDHVSRPLRIWMYNKTSIVPNNTFLTSIKLDFVNMSRDYDMYSPEYYLQDYFTQLQKSSNFSRHNLQWANNPLLADYFIIPNDFTYYYYYPDMNLINRPDFRNLVERINKEYFDTLINNIQTKFPYWTMAKQADQIGSNHILPTLSSRNMGIFSNNTQKLLQKVIQIVFTGLRHDLLPRDTSIIYRHNYDVVIPQFIRPITSKTSSQNITDLVKNKKHLLVFVGVLSDNVNMDSAQLLLRRLYTDVKNGTYNSTIGMKNKQYDTMTVIDGHLKPDEYVQLMQSTVFALCPVDYFPWSSRLYEAIQLGAIPLILADNIVLPFERFIYWPSFSVKINVSNIPNMINIIQRTDNFEEYLIKKLSNTQQFINAFRWPYSNIGETEHKKYNFLPDEDKNGTAKNAFHYISMELRCRRLEQLYGLTSDSFSSTSLDAQRYVCIKHYNICPCYDEKQTVALRQYV